MIQEHDRALEYDLMTRTGRTLTEYLNMGAAGKVALISFIGHLPPDSALYRELHPGDETVEWYRTLQTNKILADIYDVFVAAHSKKGHRPKPYPRPQRKQKFGRGAIPIEDFMKWWRGEL